MTHDDETVERVAAAINDARYSSPEYAWPAPPFEEESARGQEYAYRLARAALSAMPERDEEDDTVLRISSINEHGEAPDGSVWRNIVINGEHYTIPYEVAMWFVHRGDQRDAQRELLREALEALEPFAKGADRHDETVEHTEQERHYLPYGLQQIDLRRARAAADKIRAALEHQQKGEGL